jgi:hypothetical protein
MSSLACSRKRAQHRRNHAFTDHHGKGKCGEYVRKALQAGGASFNEFSPPHYGKLYGLTLEPLGFHEITVDDPDHFPFIRGDVMVMQPHKGGKQAGHVAGFDGKVWISDFFQTDFWAGREYRHQKPRPSYAVYRY